MMKYVDRAIVFALSAIAVVAARPVSGQDAYRQTIVVTAAATPVELGSVTRSMTILTREQMATLPVRSVADVLRLAASIDVRARGERGVQTDFVVRGATFGQMLVLVDGVRLNDVQSGHHNGDIPVPLDSVERIEILYGPGSSLFGADAFGGTVNVITRRASAAPSAVAEGGSFGFARGEAQGGFARGAVTGTVAAAADRSSGFMYDRDYKTSVVRSRASVGDSTTVSMAYLWKEFGANNFYGGNAPSREWTNQTLLSADQRLGVVAGWTLDADASYRTHGDHFIFNQVRPEISENRHRTHAVLASVTGSRRVRDVGSVTLGVEGGGDWIRSSNLGDHALNRVSGFGEWRRSLGTRMQLDASLRADHYSEFGASWNPSLGFGWWPTAAVRLRASTGRAFRIPTFTERYYHDAANLARSEVGPESAWAGEGGADVFLRQGWMLQATVFGRADRDVIDWLRPTASDLWRTYNIRDVDSRGFELGVRKTFTTDAFLQAGYSALDLNAPAVNQLSKYLLDYAPHTFLVAAALRMPAGLRVAPRLEYRRRSRSTGTSDYVVLDARLSRRVNRMLDLFVEGTNLLDRSYQEIAGVIMPGAAVTVSLRVEAR